MFLYFCGFFILSKANQMGREHVIFKSRINRSVTRLTINEIHRTMNELEEDE